MKNIFLNKDGRIRNSWWVVVFFLILSPLVFALIFVSDKFHFSISFWHQLVVIALVSVICQKLRGNPIVNLVGSPNNGWSELFGGLGIGVALMVIPALILTIFGFVHWSFNEVVVTNLLSALELMLAAVLAEELLFRGFIFQRLVARFGEWTAQIIIALLFVLTHLGNLDNHGIPKVMAMINIFIASVLFGLTYLKTRSLVMPITIHFGANVTQGSILGFAVSGNEEVSVLTPQLEIGRDVFTGGNFGIEASLPGLLTILIVTIVYFLMHKKPSLKAKHEIL